MFPALRPVAVLFLLAVVAGCTTPPPDQNRPEITFSHLPTINLAVADVQVENRFAAPLKAPHIEHQVPVAPAKAVIRWGQDRLKPAAEAGTARLIINEASMVGEALAQSGGLKGVFTKEQSDRYRATIDARLEVTDGQGVKHGFATATVSRSQTIREDATLTERETLEFELVEKLMADFNREMERNVRQHLQDWVR